MKRIKISLVAVAFLFAIGGAVASQKAFAGVNDNCADVSGCNPDPSQQCCSDFDGQGHIIGTRLGDLIP